MEEIVLNRTKKFMNFKKFNLPPLKQCEAEAGVGRTFDSRPAQTCISVF